MQPKDKNTTKLPYDTPELIVYGDIREITRSTPNLRVSDREGTTGGASDRTG